MTIFKNMAFVCKARSTTTCIYTLKVSSFVVAQQTSLRTPKNYTVAVWLKKKFYDDQNLVKSAVFCNASV